MGVSALEFLSTIQTRLPQVKVTWDKEPDFFFNERFCSFTATDIKDPTNIFSVDLLKGIGEEPLDDVVDECVQRIIKGLHL